MTAAGGGYLPPVVVRLVAETAEALAQLDAFAASLGTIGEKAAAAGAEVDAAMSGIAASTERVDAAMTTAGASVDRFAAQSKAAGTEASTAFTGPTAAADRYAASVDRDMAQVAAAQERVAASNQAMAAKMETDAAAMEGANAKAAASTEKVGTSMEATGAKSGVMGALTSKSMSMVGLGVAAVGVETVKMASTFDAKMMQLSTMAGVPVPVMQNLKQKILDIGASTGQGPDKVADAFYHLVSSGQSTDQALSNVNASAKLATMGMADLDTVSYALAGVMSAAPKDIHSADEAVSMMAATVGQGDMKVQDLANSIKSGLLPTMISAGMGMRDYGATLATMADNSMPAEMAANRLRTAILLMERPTKQGIVALKDMGMTADQLGKDMQQGGMLQAMTDLKSHIDSLPPAVGAAKMSMQQINDEGQKFHDQMIQDGASTDEANKATDKYKQTLQDTGSAGMRAINDIDTAFGGSRSAGTILLLTDETGKLQQKYDALGTSAQQAKEFNDHWNDSLQTTQTKAMIAKAGLEALGISIGEKLMPVANTLLDWVGKLGGWMEQGGAKAQVFADIIIGLGAIAVAGLAARIVSFVGGPLVSMAKGFGNVMGAIADLIAKMLGIDIATEKTATAEKTAADESAQAWKVAGQEMAQTLKISLDEMIAAVRESGPQLAAAAEEAGREAGAAEQAGMRTGIEAGKAETAAVAKTAGTEVGAAEAETARTAGEAAGVAEQAGMRTGIEAGKAETAATAKLAGTEAGAAEASGTATGITSKEAEVTAAGTAVGGAGATATKGGWLKKFGKVVGDIGILGLTIQLADQALPDMLNVEKNVSSLVDHINHSITGQALSPATQAMDASFGKMSNSVREKLGLADLYSQDGTKRLNTSITQGATGAANAWRDGIAPIPPDTQSAVNRAGTEANKFPNSVVPPVNKGADDAKARVGKMPGEFSQAVAPMPGQMKTAGDNTMQGFKDGQDPKADSIIESVKTWAGNLLKSIGQALGIASPSTIMNSMGVDFMQGFWNGINSLMDSITTSVNNWITGIVNAVKGALAINSPSHVMHEIGEGFMEGFHNGILARQQEVIRTCQQTAELTIGAFSTEAIDQHIQGWANMQGFNGPNDNEELARIGEEALQRQQNMGFGGMSQNRWGCWICGQQDHKPINCPNKDTVLTLTRSNSGIGVQDSTVQAGNVTNITVQGTVLDHQGIFQALQEAALRAGQRNSFTGGFGSPR